MTALHNLYEVQKATFGTEAGDEPDVYEDYDRLVELCGKMGAAVAEVENLTCLLDGMNAPTHDGDPVHDCEAKALSLAGRVAALVARIKAVKS